MPGVKKRAKVPSKAALVLDGILDSPKDDVLRQLVEAAIPGAGHRKNIRSGRRGVSVELAMRLDLYTSGVVAARDWVDWDALVADFRGVVKRLEE